MKKILCALAAIFATCYIYGQPLNIFQKRDDLKDFSSKTTQVVVKGNNSLDDVMLIDAVKKYWIISPYEICPMERFEEIKTDTSYFFLMRVDGQFSKEKEPSMEFLTLVRGSEKASEGINFMPDVLSLPYRTLDDDSGDSFAYLAPFINIIQKHIAKVQEKKISSYVGMGAYSDGMNEAKDKTILFCPEDFCFGISQEMLDNDFHGKAKLVTKEEKEQAIDNWSPDTLIAVIVSPSVNQKGAYCFKMLISTDTRELFLYKKHKMSGKFGSGFTPEDYKRIATPYAY
ncbi:MAG: hypothetical protein J6U88_03560 [Bacteroidales bacterium]|nr:hypothetical protein [Bacteroidales bacterium]